ncbi:ATP-binding cassette domain-containing protein [Mycoplasmopsis cricetuli]|uniref:ATP-binding cassette domain-containing protein n=1 Tax=Mycoplasmopsis cricetuli TaxID=171283 RepID=UPI000472FB83|nr:ATP-binding cassette domain-containing protein [Mycoplasmopsis cricetuli]
MKNIIVFENVNISYDKNLIFDNLNLQIPKEKMIAIIGKSGSGKTTLLTSIIDNEKVSNGKIFFNKEIISDKLKKNLNKDIAFLSQNTNLIESDSVYNSIVRSNIKYKNFWYKMFSILTNEQEKLIFFYLKKLNILNKIFTRTDELSGGEKQRVEIAKILMKKSKIILADEPTSSLDYSSSKEVIKLLKWLNNEYNLSILVIMHDLQLAFKNFDYFLVVKDKTVKLIENKNLTFDQVKELI